MVCQRLCVTKWCVKDGVLKMACERWCVTKWCVKWCVTKWCVKEGVSKMVCERWSVTKWCVRCVAKLCGKDRVSKMVAQCRKCQACHAKRRWMSPSATLATQNEGTCHQVPRLPRKVPRHHRRLIPAQARQQSQPSAISAKPATQSAGICRQVPGLPKCRGVTGD